MLPDISISIEEMNTKTFESIRGIASRQRVDTSLYQSSGGAASGKSARAGGASKVAAVGAGAAPDMAGAGEEAEAGGKSGKGADTMFYRITCRDNGCGMPHERIPDSAFKGRDALACRLAPSSLQGRVCICPSGHRLQCWGACSRDQSTACARRAGNSALAPRWLSSGRRSRLAVRAAEEMGPSAALLTRRAYPTVPIDVISAHLSSGTRRGGAAPGRSADGEGEASSGAPLRIPAKVTTCKLDIDIQNNVPQVRRLPVPFRPTLFHSRWPACTRRRRLRSPPLCPRGSLAGARSRARGQRRRLGRLAANRRHLRRLERVQVDSHALLPAARRQ